MLQESASNDKFRNWLNRLLPEHRQELEASGISLVVAWENGVRSIPQDRVGSLLATMRLRPSPARSALAYFYPHAPGFCRVKLFPRRIDSPKYLQPRGRGNHLYIPAGVDIKRDEPLFLVEGEKKALSLLTHGFQAIAVGGVWSWKGQGEPIPDLDRVRWEGREVNIVFDSDKAKNDSVRAAQRELARELHHRGAKVLIIDLPSGRSEPKGVDDYIVRYGVEAFVELPKWEDQPIHTLEDALLGQGSMVMSFPEFLVMNQPTREYLVRPWLEKGSIVLVYGDAGVGKSRFVCEVARTVASIEEHGMAGLWKADGYHKVLIVDGELPSRELQARAFEHDLGFDPNAHPLAPVNYDCGRRVIPLSRLELECRGISPTLNLAEAQHREYIRRVVVEHGVKLLVLDNIYSLFVGLDLNNSREWSPVNEWLLTLRAYGVTTILVHHTTKEGDQFGTVTKLWNVNTALRLVNAKRPGEEDLAAFTIKVDKARGQGLNLTGLRFLCNNGEWEVENAKAPQAATKESKKQHIARMLVEGAKQVDIAAELGVSKQHVYTVKKKLVEDKILAQEGKTFRLTPKGDKWLDSFEEGADLGRVALTN